MESFSGRAKVASITEKQVTTEYVAAGLDWCKRSGGVVRSEDDLLNQLFSEIQICARGDCAGPPPYLFVGPKSGLRALFGNEFHKSAPGRVGVPDIEYENAVNGSYWAAAQTGKHILDHIRARTIGIGNRPIWHEYQRLIVPGTLASGRNVFVAFTQHLRVFREVADTRQHLPS